MGGPAVDQLLAVARNSSYVFSDGFSGSRPAFLNMSLL